MAPSPVLNHLNNNALRFNGFWRASHFFNLLNLGVLHVLTPPGVKSMKILIFLLCLCVTAAQAQTLKPGDTLSVSVMQDSKLDRTVVVDPSGQIAFPLAGHFRVHGLTPQAVENILKQRLRSNYKDESLDVTVALANSAVPEEDLKPKIFITGEVLRPGSYVVRQRTTLMQAIALAGGLGPFAAKRRIMVRRRGGPGEDIF